MDEAEEQGGSLDQVSMWFIGRGWSWNAAEDLGSISKEFFRSFSRFTMHSYGARMRLVFVEYTQAIDLSLYSSPKYLFSNLLYAYKRRLLSCTTHQLYLDVSIYQRDLEKILKIA